MRIRHCMETKEKPSDSIRVDAYDDYDFENDDMHTIELSFWSPRPVDAYHSVFLNEEEARYLIKVLQEHLDKKDDDGDEIPL